MGVWVRVRDYYWGTVTVTVTVRVMVTVTDMDTVTDAGMVRPDLVTWKRRNITHSGTRYPNPDLDFF